MNFYMLRVGSQVCYQDTGCFGGCWYVIKTHGMQAVSEIVHDVAELSCHSLCMSL